MIISYMSNIASISVLLNKFDVNILSLSFNSSTNKLAEQRMPSFTDLRTN